MVWYDFVALDVYFKNASYNFLWILHGSGGMKFKSDFCPPLPGGARPMARPKLQFISRTSTPNVNMVRYDFVALHVGNKIMYGRAL